MSDLRRRLDDRLTRRDWRRILILTELMFASDVFGVGVEWETVTGRDQLDDLVLLREIQRLPLARPLAARSGAIQ